MELVEIAAGAYQLRPWADYDAQEVYEACQDPDIQRFTTVPVPYSRADAEHFVATHSPQGWESGSSPCFAVKEATTGRVMAAVDLHGVNPRLRSADIGYWCAPWARGQGVITTAARAVCGWAFGTGLVDYIGWRAVAGNDGSRRVAEKLGFTIEGIMRAEFVDKQTGERVDSWYGSLLRGELR
jgi:RimJ/RimL family protein N-acetyltransferase